MSFPERSKVFSRHAHKKVARLKRIREDIEASVPKPPEREIATGGTVIPSMEEWARKRNII